MSPPSELHPQSASVPASKPWAWGLAALVCAAVFWFAQRPAELGSLRVVFAPTGASVELSGSGLGAVERKDTDTQVEFSGLNAGASYRLSVNAPGYTQSIQEIKIPIAGGTQNVQVFLKRENALFTVRSEPTGAVIFMDGREIGPAPAVLDEVEPGPHQVEAALTGYKRAALRFDAKAGERRDLRLTLELAETPVGQEAQASVAFVKDAPQARPGKAILRVESSHPSKFFLDNLLLGYGQTVEREVDAGRHRVSARADGLGSKYEMVRLKSQGQHVVRFTFDDDPVEKAMQATDPNQPIYWMIRGGNARGEGRYGDAVSAFETALERNPTREERASLHRQLSRTLPGLKRFDEAIEHAETYLRLSPDAPDAAFTRGLLLEFRKLSAQQAAGR